MKLIQNKLFRFVIIGVSFVMVVSLSRSIYSLWHKRDRIKDQEEAFTRIQNENAELLRRLQEAQTPEFVERQAREKLGLVKKGEIIVLVPKPIPATAPGEPADQLPNWKKWWGLFF